MYHLKVIIVLVAISAAVLALPAPYGFDKHSSHHTIHVPFKVHTIHHTHIQKVPVYKEIVKEVPVVKEVVKEVPVVKEVIKEVPVVKEVIKEVPVIKAIHIPVIKEVKVPVPIHVHDDFSSHGKDWGSHEW